MMNQQGCFGAGQEMSQVQPIVCPPEYCFRDEFIPREVPVIHPFVNVNRQHYVDVPRHFYTETTENIMGAPIIAQGGFGPGFGGGFGPRFGPGFGRAGRSPWM